MSDDRQALVQAVIQCPADDTPRLVYADWLDEHGEPERAEFIRVQCRLAGREVPDDERRRLGRREKALLKAHERGWVAAVAFSWGKPAWHRGFVNAFAFPHALRSEAPRVFAEHPVTVIGYLCEPGEVGEVASFPPLGRVEMLTVVCDTVRPEDAAAIAASRLCDHLVTLTFRTAEAVDAAARAHLRGRFGKRVVFSRSR